MDGLLSVERLGQRGIRNSLQLRVRGERRLYGLLMQHSNYTENESSGQNSSRRFQLRIATRHFRPTSKGRDVITDLNRLPSL